MHVLMIANQKGGVGKTTSTAAIAGACLQRGLRTLVVDMDPQASLTTYLGYDPEKLSYSLFDWFQAAASGETFEAHQTVLATSFEGLSLIAATPSMATLDRRLGVREGMGLVVQKMFETLQEDYDQIIIDCPSNLGVLMVNALAACHFLLIPTQTEHLALKGLERMMRTLQMVSRTRPQHLDYLILPTMFDRRTRASLQSLRTLREQYDEHIWSQVIPIDTRFRDASRMGSLLTLSQPESHGARAYLELVEELWKQRCR